MKAHLNPFAPDRIQRLLPFDPTLSGTTWEAIESRWEKLSRRAAVRGHHGSGKTTFLDAFAPRLQPRFRVERLFLHRDSRQLDQEQRQLLESIRGQQDVILFVDGEGHLTGSERKALRKLSLTLGGYLAARHHRSRLPTLLHLKSDPLLARTLLEKIEPAASRELHESLPAIFRKKNGNLRELWLSLYDNYANETDHDRASSAQPPESQRTRS
ncbi:hypothetical protein AAFN60_19575 [Roseibacillus persicicus]|uniref:hypothetical protein n=1 Tax=Roseibacillus persicicus TaxID=454148 RepID=UPI00398B1580